MVLYSKFVKLLKLDSKTVAMLARYVKTPAKQEIKKDK